MSSAAQRLWVALSAAALALSGGALASATVSQSEGVRVSVDGKLSPKRLPRKGTAPISVAVGWDISTADGSPPPKLNSLQIEINRHGRLDYTGLPSCPYPKIQPASTKRALQGCRPSLVGRGTFSAEVSLAGQEESYETKGQLLLFKGERKQKTVLYGQIYAAHPFATSFVIPFAIESKARGLYGTVLAATLPASLRSWGNLTGIEMRLKRTYPYKGSRHSFLSAGCPAPKGFGQASFDLARTSFAFDGGQKISATVGGSCRVGGRGREGRAQRRGSTHRKPSKRAKSVSQEQSSAPCSIASAARCASLVRFPAAPVGSRSSRRSEAWSGAGWITSATGCSSQPST